MTIILTTIAIIGSLSVMWAIEHFRRVIAEDKAQRSKYEASQLSETIKEDNQLKESLTQLEIKQHEEERNLHSSSTRSGFESDSL